MKSLEIIFRYVYNMQNMAVEIILKNFDHWIKGLGPLGARKAVFNHIRDIPYYLVPQIEDPLVWAESILRTSKASCTPKHYLLGFLFTKLGIPIDYVTYPFKWSEQPINYPAKIKELAQGSPTGYHLSCKAQIKGRWVLVDATWDSGLKKSGFPVNDNWDGLSNTLNAVVPIEEVIHSTLEDRLSYVREKKKLIPEEQKAIYAEFITQFNLWLESLRRQ
ncbi:MAG: hypothetical protein MUC39_03305 [Candidatus Omnitrophica bacterium]|jgi:hypothetical protein|nr:hypothetical protein [Candidatus Omnitrophota bacterium]